MTKDNSKKPKAKDTKTTHKKVFDVTPPGKSLALPNSRSVIMGHKRQARDDQFVPGGGSGSSSSPSSGLGNPSEKHPLLDSHEKIDLKPGTDSGSASKEDASSRDVTGLAPMSPEATTTTPATAPVLPENVATPATMAPTTSEDTAFAETTKSADAAASTAPLVPPNTNAASFGAHDNMSTSDLLADLAVEQVVDQPGLEPSSTKGDGSVSTDAASGGSLAGTRNGGAGGPKSTKGVPASDVSPGATADASRPKTVDDLLAETGAPDLSPQKAIVSTHHHRGRFFHIVLTFLLILIVGAVALNFLLDAGIIETELDLPYTDVIK